MYVNEIIILILNENDKK